MFRVPDELWDYFIGEKKRFLCRKCFEQIVEWVKEEELEFVGPWIEACCLEGE